MSGSQIVGDSDREERDWMRESYKQQRTKILHVCAGDLLE